MNKFIRRIFIKLALIILIIIFALFNCKYISFQYGFSDVSINNKTTYSGAISHIKNIQKIEYYRKDILNNDNKYMVYIISNGSTALLEATEADIVAIELAGATDIYAVKEISPVPFYFELMLMIFIAFYPHRSKDEGGWPADNLKK